LARSSIKSDLAALEERLGHRFKNRELLSLALSHASIGAESNERLEFLGDRVLGLIVAERLYDGYPGEAEGGLAVRLNALVRQEACAKVGEAVGLAPHLIMASSESGSGGRRKSAILAGACEAVIAAVYLDGGIEAARRFVLRYWDELFATLKPELRDAKTALQEWAQSGTRTEKAQPVYAVKQRSGPDHAPLFTVEVRIPGEESEQGEGSTKRDAEQDAAHRMLLRLGLWKE
jgi:ribonuclease-3